MGKEIKTIGILSSGGDAPGMNAVIRAITRTALYNGMKVIGIRRGFAGLMKGDMFEMNMRSVSDILQRGGTMLHTARSPEFVEDAGVELGKEKCLEMGIDGIVVCGGDGSFRGARDLAAKGIPCVGVPCTIDNDIPCTEYTIGFDTAVNTVTENIDRIRDTSQSHERCSVVEVMGRRCGDIALQSAICCGAVSVLIPEVPYDLERDVVEKMQRTIRTGKRHFIVIVAEGVTLYSKDAKSSAEIADYIEKRTGFITRSTILGHIQRGGTPTARERVIAARMGHHAVEVLARGIGNRIIAMQANKIVDLDLEEALKMTKELDVDMLRTAHEISL
ncbi:6-phosphofructokinase [Oscillospiraceae bacterium MB08-C2-2]|nr:6-phosphofructokinase [Oscillospiraceae bacterium MB08-C2-2]